MIVFTCASCQKKLSVKDELAGKKGKCPGCGKPVAVPQLAASLSPQPGNPASLANERTLPPHPSSAAQERTQPPEPDRAAKESVSDAGGKTAPGHGQKADTTQSMAGQGLSPELYDFLAPAQQPDEIGRLGGYRILKVLGAGGMGVQAEDPKLKRKLAIKAMLPTLAASESAKQRFLREAQTAAAIEHDHIVAIHQVGEDRGVPFIAMPLLKGEPLDERLKRDQVLPVAEVLRIGRETARGLAAAHAAGLVHRDIKPANLWLESQPGEPGASATGGRVKILDFGLARAAADTSQLTQQGAIIGTPAYMAPEQAAGQTVDARCDLFSLSCVLYRLCTGVLPFKGTDTVSTLMAVALESPPAPLELRPELPRGLSELVMQLLAKKPEERIASAQEVVEALRLLEQGQPATVTMPRPQIKISPPNKAASVRDRKSQVTMSAVGPANKSRLPVFLALGGGLAVAFVAGIVIFWPRTVGDQGPTDAPLSSNFTSSLGMEFVLVPKGKSWLGGGGGQPGDKEVEIVHDFYLGKYEVTQEEWQKVMGNNPNWYSRTGKGKNAVEDVSDEELKRFPVESVSWDDAQRFLAELNKGANKKGWLYRLPKEVEWEYACRGGPMEDKSQIAFHYYFEKPTNQIGQTQANIVDAGKGLQRPAKVGSYPPNRLGLFDMHGNVWEWCEDPPAKAMAPERVHRGGDFNRGADACRATDHTFYGTGSAGSNGGFRVARVPAGKEIIKLAPENKKSPVEAKDPTTFKNSLDMEFVLVPKGKSWLGGGGGKPGDKEVEIAHDFYLGKYEVTQEEWEKVTGNNPSGYTRARGFPYVKDVPEADLKRFPVEMVSWDDAQEFLEQLNQRDKKEGWVYRLPSEDEWEYACRGGPIDKSDSTFDYYVDKPSLQIRTDQANFAHDKGLKRTCKVGSYPPNRLGLHDMHGNVREWCQDEHKRPGEPSYKAHTIGLRVARVPAGKETVKTIPVPSADYAELVKDRPWTRVLTSEAEFKRLREEKAFGDIEPKYEGGTLELRNSGFLRICERARDVIVRARVKIVNGHNVTIWVRDVNNDGRAAYFAGGNFFGIGTRRKGPLEELKATTLARHYGDFFELAFSAVGPRLTVYADGRKILEARDAAPQTGNNLIVQAVQSQSLLRDIEYQILDK